MESSRNLLATVGTTLVLGAAVTTLPVFASSEKLKEYQLLCEKNTLCSAEARDDGLLFKIRKGGRTQIVFCKSNGACEVLLPRSASYPIGDAGMRLSAR